MFQVPKIHSLDAETGDLNFFPILATHQSQGFHHISLAEAGQVDGLKGFDINT